MSAMSNNWSLAAYIVNDTFTHVCESWLIGRDRWTREVRLKAGPRGIAAIEMSGPRIHACIHDLHHEHGRNIDREREPFGGDFPGGHARNLLLSSVTQKIAERLAA